MDEAAHFADIGVSFGEPKIDLDKLRAHKDKVVGKLTGGLAGMAKARKVTVVRGYGSSSTPTTSRSRRRPATAGQDRRQAGRALRAGIIAAGSAAVQPAVHPEDPRIVDSTGALELRHVPKKLLVIGGGIIGLEMATVYSTLGSRIDVVEMLDGLMPGADRDLVKVWQKLNAKRFDKIMLKTKTVAVEAQARRHRRSSSKASGAPARAAASTTWCCRPWAARRTASKIGAEKAGVAVNERGFIPVDSQMRTNVPHIFAIGDIIGQPMLAHKAVHEAHVAAEAAAGEKSHFDARVIPSVAYTDPEVAWVGLTEDEAKAQGIKLKKGQFPWAATGRAIANGRDEGFTKLLFDEETHRIVGGGIVGTHAGDLISEIALADRDGRRRGRHRQDDPSASDAGRIDRHGGGSLQGRLHRPAAAEEVVAGRDADPRDRRGDA